MFDKIIKGVISAFEQENSIQLRKLSRDAIQESVNNQDKLLLDLAVVSYSVCKILSKSYYREKPEWAGFSDSLLKKLEDARKVQNDYSFAKKKMEEAINIISKFDKEFGRYLAWVIHKAKIKKGSSLYYYGLSVGMASNLSGISEWELMDYIGKTKDSEQSPIGKKVGERMIYLRKVL